MSIHAEVDPKSDSDRTRMADRAALSAVAAVAFERLSSGAVLSERLEAAISGFGRMLNDLVGEIQSEPDDAVAMRLSQSMGDALGPEAGVIDKMASRLEGVGERGDPADLYKVATTLSEIFAEEVERVRREQVENDKNDSGLLETA